MAPRAVRRNPKLKDHEVVLALSKAKAALWLLDQIHYGDLSYLSLRGDAARTELPCWKTEEMNLDPVDVKDWLEEMIFDAIAEAVKDTEEAFVKHATKKPAEVA